jgi:Leucine-rich repeat (LRR) protein
MWLDVSDNLLTEADVSNNRWLNYLDVRGNFMNSVDDVIGRNTLLALNQFFFLPQKADTRPSITADFVCPNFLFAVREITGIFEPRHILSGHVNSIKSLNLSSRQINDLAGIQHFTALEELDVSNNRLTSLNVSANTELKTLRVHDNFISTPDNVTGRSSLFAHAGNRGDNGSPFWFFPQGEIIDITADFECPNFLAAVRWHVGVPAPNPIFLHHVNGIEDGFGVDNRNITSLAGIQHFTALRSLSASNNSLTKLDMSNNHLLQQLDVRWNSLTELNVSNNYWLQFLDVSWNRFTELDVSNNHVLSWSGGLRVYYNFIDTPDDVIGWNNWFSRAGELRDWDSGFWFYPQRPDDDITSDFVCPVFRARVMQTSDPSPLGQTPILPHHVNGITDFNAHGISDLAGIQHLTALQTLSAAYGDLTEIDLSNNPALEWLDVQYNQLTELDLSNNPMLRQLFANDNQLTKLDLSNNPALEQIRVNNNQLTALNLSNNPALRWIFAEENKLTGLDVTNTWLIMLHIHDNFIKSPDDVIGWNSYFSIVGESESDAFRFYPQNDPPPPTGISDITRPAALMLAFLALSAALWVYVLRRKFVRG